MASLFETLNAVNVNSNTEEKNGLTYLSWAWAWAEVKKVVPDAQYTIYERETEYGPVNYFTDGRTCWVKTGVTLQGLEHIEELPVMDFRNRSILLEAITSTDVNKAIQRSLTKACARHGLGLYIYAGEDLPECEKETGTAPNIPKTGSTEAAQEVGRAKVQQMTEAAEPVKLIAPGQARFILDNCPENELAKYKAKYGEDLARMPYGNASRFVKMLQERIREKGQAG